MFLWRIVSIRSLAILLLGLVLAASAYALAAANIVVGSKAGDGAGAITPYVVGSIKYTLDKNNNPRNIQKVQFAVNLSAGSSAKSPGTVHARIDSGIWVDCANIGGVTWECSFSSPYPTVQVSPPTTLEVVAAQ